MKSRFQVGVVMKLTASMEMELDSETQKLEARITDFEQEVDGGVHVVEGPEIDAVLTKWLAAKGMSVALTSYVQNFNAVLADFIKNSEASKGEVV